MSHPIYDHGQIEEKWQKIWQQKKLFQDTPGSDSKKSSKDKIFILFAFAYPSGSGLHVGHVESKTALDILARYYRMQGKDVFFPVGWDAFGLPAENYAIKTGVHPAKTTKDAIDTFRRQIKRLGVSYDWANEIATSHPEYYHWTQWLFLQLYKKGLAYQGTGMVNWCPSCQTVLANEQVVNGNCERCGTQVIQKEMKQWFFKITEYQDELISGLNQVDWPRATKLQQLNWIGRSEGAEVNFKIKESKEILTCFTTRVDTIFGVTFLVVSPEKFEEMKLMNLVEKGHQQTVQNYIDQAYKKTEEQRKIGEKEKTGVNTGLKVINPVSGKEVPVFVADYVLGGYGTGIVMGVPGHDGRDFDFATKFNLPVVPVIFFPALGKNQPIDRVFATYEDSDGTLVNSGKYDGLHFEQAVKQITRDFPEDILKSTTYKLRDWLISRQRYWGAPIPIVYDPEGNPHPVKEEHLPWTLPDDVEFKPTGESPLKYSQEFKKRTEDLYGKGWTPEYDTMDTFVDSSWYFFRYVDSRNQNQFASKNRVEQWLPVDLYMIGPEHIVLHLLYSRFFTKFLRDEGYCNFDEPFMKMRHQGMILGPDGKKMSKSKGNVINPDDVIEKYGADTLRMYEMFMGPIEADKPWSTSSVVGIYRFLTRIFNLTQSALQAKTEKSDDKILRKLHQTLHKVTKDIPELKFNTAIAAMMEFINEWEKDPFLLSKKDLKIFVQVLAPFAPFLAEELWESIDTTSIHLSEWPETNKEFLMEKQLTVAVQINGKVRGEVHIASQDISSEDEVVSLAKQEESLKKWITGQIIKTIYIPGKIINFVVKS